MRVAELEGLSEDEMAAIFGAQRHRAALGVDRRRHDDLQLLTTKGNGVG